MGSQMNLRWMLVLALFSSAVALAATKAKPGESAEKVAEKVAEKSRAVVIGHLYGPEAFTPQRLQHVGDLDRLITDFNLEAGETVGVRQEDFSGDGEPELLAVSPARLCNEGRCSYALFDGKTLREIGRFYGSLVVLDRKTNRYPVIQTINQQDPGYYSLRTYVFIDATYQVQDDVLIPEGAYLRLLKKLDDRR